MKAGVGKWQGGEGVWRKRRKVTHEILPHSEIAEKRLVVSD